MKLLVLTLLFALPVSADTCKSLEVRYYAIKERGVYVELINEAGRLIEKGCSEGNKAYISASERVLTALEILSEDIRVENKSSEKMARERIVESQRVINMTHNYREKYPVLFNYQVLFYQIARENLNHKDYEHALKYSQMSYLLGRAILDLR